MELRLLHFIPPELVAHAALARRPPQVDHGRAILAAAALEPPLLARPSPDRVALLAARNHRAAELALVEDLALLAVEGGDVLRVLTGVLLDWDTSIIDKL